MADRIKAQLGPVQETLFIPLAARARETGKKRPLLRDDKAVELVQTIDFPAEKYERGWGSVIMVLRTAAFDAWVQQFLDAHPDGTVVEIGTGLNTRFERVDNGAVHWFDLDLPDTTALRRQFFEDSDRRRMLAASVLDTDWLEVVGRSKGPYFFVAEGVLVYLPEDDVRRTLERIAQRFPGATIAFDTYGRKLLERQHERADRGDIAARWSWACDDPRTLESTVLRMRESTTVARPPASLRARLPIGYRVVLPLVDRLLRRMNAFRITVFDARRAG